MRLFMIFDNHGEEVAPIIRKLEKAGHQVLYWAGASNKEASNFPVIIFHAGKDARLGKPPPGVDINKYPPPGAKFLTKLYETESVTMDLTHKALHQLPYPERKHIYHNMVRYWHGALQEHRPDAVIFPLSPNANYSYLVYSLAKFLGIRTIMFSDTWVSDRTFLHYDIWEGSPALQNTLRTNEGKNFTADDLSPDIREYYQWQTKGKNPNSAAPWYYELRKKQHSQKSMVMQKIRALKTAIVKGTVFSLPYRYAVKLLKSNPRKEYGEMEVMPDLRKPYVYVPLQFQPERTTSPQGGVYVDQILMVEMISASLPEGWVVYVKEHPTQWFKSGINYSPYRYPGYYKKLAGIKNAFLVPVKTDTFKLTENAQAVATVTGTPGWEAMLRGKPAVIFGFPWYRDCPEVLIADDVESCREAFMKIRDGLRPQTSGMLRYLKSFDESTIHCYVDDMANTFDDSASALSSEERLDNLAQTIINELNT